MSNLDLLKSLTLGKDDVKKVKLEINGEDKEFKIRPLTDGELTELKAMEKSPIDLKLKLGADGKRTQSKEEILEGQEADINPAEFTKAQAETKYTAISYGLSVDGEHISVDDVKVLPAGIPDMLFDEIIKISNLTDSDLTTVKKFRNN